MSQSHFGISTPTGCFWFWKNFLCWGCQGWAGCVSTASVPPGCPAGIPQRQQVGRGKEQDQASVQMSKGRINNCLSRICPSSLFQTWKALLLTWLLPLEELWAFDRSVYVFCIPRRSLPGSPLTVLSPHPGRRWPRPSGKPESSIPTCRSHEWWCTKKLSWKKGKNKWGKRACVVQGLSHDWSASWTCPGMWNALLRHRVCSCCSPSAFSDFILPKYVCSAYLHMVVNSVSRRACSINSCHVLRAAKNWPFYVALLFTKHLSISYPVSVCRDSLRKVLLPLCRWERFIIGDTKGRWVKSFIYGHWELYIKERTIKEKIALTT